MAIARSHSLSPLYLVLRRMCQCQWQCRLWNSSRIRQHRWECSTDQRQPHPCQRRVTFHHPHPSPARNKDLFHATQAPRSKCSRTKTCVADLEAIDPSTGTLRHPETCRKEVVSVNMRVLFLQQQQLLQQKKKTKTKKKMDDDSPRRCTRRTAPVATR